MGSQSARLWFDGHDHKDTVFNGFHHNKLYIGETLLCEKLNRHPRFSQFFMVEEVISSYGPNVVDEYGVRLAVNADAVVEKCGVYLIGGGSRYSCALACKCTGITAV